MNRTHGKSKTPEFKSWVEMKQRCENPNNQSSPQENANQVWKALADKHGFVWDSCGPANTGDQHDFTAEPLT